MDKETLSLVLDTVYENAYNDGYNDCKSKAKDYIKKLRESYGESNISLNDNKEEKKYGYNKFIC